MCLKQSSHGYFRQQRLTASWVQADSLCFQIEKQLKEFGDKVSEDIKSKVEEKVASLRKSVADDDLEGMKAGIEALNQVSHKICS